MRNIVALAGDTATASPNTKTAMIKIAAGNTLVTDAMVIVTPNPLDFVDFQAGHSYRQRVQLRNVSPVIQRLRIEPPRTHHFRIVRNRIASDSFEALTLVPGFDATIEVEFVAPEERRRPRPAELLSPAIGSPKELTVYPADRAVAVEQGPVIDDRIAVHVHGIPEPLLIPLRASAAVAQIEAPDGVDFGVVKALKQRPVSASLTLAKGTVRGASAGGANGGLIRAAGGSAHSTGSSNRSAGGPASASSSPASARFRHVTSVSKTINIVNTGAKDVCVELLHDKAHPLRVTPSRVTLAAGSSQKVRLDFVPVKAGPFKSELVLREVAAIATSVVSTPRKAIGSLTSLLSSGMDGNGEAHGADPFNLDESSPGVIKTIGLSATVVDRQLQFCDVDGTCELEFNSLDFGTIYAGDQCVIRTRLRNRGSAAVRWTIVASEVTKQKTSRQDQATLEDPKAVIVSPSEGVLQPHSDSLVEFTFAPKFKAEKVHFKSQSIKINPKQYISRLQLQMMDSAMPSVVKDDPLDLVFKSRVCMIDARLSTDALSFGKRATGDRVCQSLTLFNENQEMPMTFAIDKTANFKCSPASGRVAPKSFIKIEVSFAPNQIGDLGKEMKVNLYGITESNVKKPLAVQKFRVSGIGFCATKTKTADPARIDGGADDKRLDNHAKLSSTDMDIRGTEHALAGSEDDQIAAAHGIGRFNNFHGDDQLSMDSDIIEFERNRKHYNDYIRRHRKETMKETRRAILLGQRENEDMVDDKKITREIIEEWQKTDIDNGLLPPEPRLLAKKTKSSVFDAVSVPRSIAVIRRKVVSLAQEKHLDPVQPSFNHGEEARLLFLFQRLLESGRILSENAPLVTVDAHGILQKVNATKFLEAGSLNASELANIHTLSSELDFGLITNHGKATATLCFLNSTAGKTPIKVSLGKSGASFRDADNPGQLDIMTFEPSTLIIPPFTIGVFRVHLEVHRSDADLVRSEGFIGSKLEYRVNDRFKYFMPIVATMDPIEVDLVGDSIVDDVITIAVTPGKEHQHMALLGESTFQLLNSGKNKARFSFERVSQQKHDDGRVEFQPASGVLPGKSTLTVKAVFHPSLKQRVDHAFEFKVFDPYFDTVSQSQPNTEKKNITFGDTLETLPSIVSKTRIRVVGTVTECKVSMIGAGERVKSHPQLDFGQLPVSTRQFAAFSRSHVPTGHGLYPVKTIKLRNSSANFAFFTVSKSNLQSEVVFSPQSGVIGPDGGVLELAVWVVPSFETAQPIEDQIVVNVAGLGKQLTIPVIYNSQAPRVQCSQVGPMKFSCTVGGTDEQTISFKNEGSVAAKVIIDLRKLPGLDLVLAKVIAGQKLASIAPQHNLPIFSRQNTASAPKAKSTEAMFRNLRPGVDDDAIDWCITTQDVNTAKKELALDGITKNCSKYDAIYVFELLPLQNASLKLAFKPKEPMVLNDQLSIHVLGMKGVDVDPSSLKLSFPTDLRGLMSPLKVSRTEILFRDKIFYNPELNDKIGTSLSTFQSVSLCETIELTNVTDQPFNWTLDRKRLNSADSTSRRTNSAVTDKDGNAVKETMSVVFDDTHLVFQYNTRFGHLAPGETARFSVTFVPLAVGRYSSIVPIYADIHGQVSHMTSLELAGACVEPSLAFSPPEIFIPVLPPGEEVMVAFSVVSYGYERNDISCAFGDDLKLLLVGADKELKRNAATANDQTAIPNKGKAMVGESSGIVAREDHHGAARLFFPEGRQLKRDGEPLMVVLKFKAPARQPTAFTSRLCFAVNASRETPALNPHTSDTSYLMIHGSSDSSALTVWPFHEQKLAMDEFALLQTTGAYENVAKLKTKVLERLRSLDFGAEKVIHKDQLFLASKFFHSPSGFPLEPSTRIADRAYDELSDIINRWLVEPYNLQSSNADFPQNFVDANGSLLVDLINHLTGKKVPVFLATLNMSHQNVQVRINALMRQNTDIINFLKSQGALLSTVRAEFLLSEDDFQVWLKARLVKLQSDSNTLAFHPEFLDYHRKLGQHFHCISREAWINILLQVAKIYVFDQIDATSFRTSPGMDSKEELQFYEEAVRSRQLLKEATVAQSASEGYLLRWLSYSSFRHTGKWQLAADFRSELANGRLIANTILAHIPDGNAVVDLKRIKEKESSAQEWEAAIRNALGDIFVSTIDEFVLGDENLRHGFKQNSVSFGMFSLSSQYGLPQFLGKSTIDFAGKLHQSSVRSLEVNNSSNKTITYNVVLDAPKEFSLLSAAGEPEYKHSRSCSVTVVNENVLMARLAPKSTFQLPIHFTARFAHSSSGLLMLKSRTIALNNLSILLFEVQSKVEAPTAQKMFYLKSPIYAISPPSKLTIDVENPFDCAGNFVLKMKETMCLDADGGNMAVVIAGAASNVPDATIIAGSQRKPLLPSIPKNAKGKSSTSTAPNAFAIREKSIRIAARSTATLDLTFIPLRVGTYECSITFTDYDVGEFTYLVEGTATPPAISNHLTWTAKTNSTAMKAIPLHHQNSMREKAILAAMMAGGYEQRAATAQDMTGVIRSSTMSLADGMNSKKGENGKTTNAGIVLEQNTHQLTPKIPIRYTVTYSSPFFNGPSEVVITPPTEPKVKDRRIGAIMPLENKVQELIATFRPKESGKYACLITLKGVDFPDYRVFHVTGVAVNDGPKAELNFSTPMHQSVTQEIPFVNRTDNDWTIKSIIQQGAHNFSGPSQIVVTAGTTAHYPITFSPAKTGEKCSGGLLLTNIGTDQKFVYHLSGVGEDPHPEEVIALTAPAREIMKRTVNLNGYADNKNVDVQLMASSPLVQCRMTPAVSKSRALLGDTLHPMSTKVDVSFHALASGSYTASLSIRSKADQSLLAWYRFELTASAAPAESQLVMVTTARETVKLQIPLVNPLASTVQFDVTYQGVGLQGDSAVRLAPNAENLYTLTFTPILPLDMMGWVKFSSSTIGEFWYELHLQASEAPCQRLPPLAAHVGQCAATTVRIANPTVNDARVRIDLSNGNNFRVVPTGTDITSCMLQSRPDSMHSTVIPALCTTELMLIFWPSTLGGADEPAHRTMLEVTGDTVGKYRFEVEGSGTRPDASSQGIRMPEITARGSKGRAVVSSVIFTNPFVDQALQVMISVHDGKSSKKQSILAGGSDVDSNSPSSSDSCLFQLVPPGGVKRSFLGSTASLLGGSSSTLAAQATAPITTKHTLGPLEKHEIPFTFNATSMEQQSAELVVEAPTMGLRWIFPVIGVCEVAVTNNVHLTLMPTSSGRCGAASAHAALEARVGETLSAYVDVPLPGFVAARKGVAGAEDLDKVVLNVDVTKFTESSAALAVRNNGGGSSTGTPISSQFDLAPPLKASFLYVTGPSTTEKGTGGKLHPTARIIVRFTPKETGQTGATVVLNDGVSKARWTVPFRMRAL